MLEGEEDEQDAEQDKEGGGVAMLGSAKVVEQPCGVCLLHTYSATFAHRPSFYPLHSSFEWLAFSH